MPSYRDEERNFLTWNEYFMAVALLAAKRSKDPSTQVGACIVNKDNRIVATGYNGMPNRVPDDKVPWLKEGSFLDTKYAYVVHAELNAILNSILTDQTNCRVYVSLHPCNECAKAVIQSGIRHVIYLSDKHKARESTKAAKILFELAGVKCESFHELVSSVKMNYDFDLKICIDFYPHINVRNSSRHHLTWDEYFMTVALLAAKRSKDPSTKVGACIVRKDNKIVATGYNGMPNGINDDMVPWTRDGDFLKTKYAYMVHAELNSILNSILTDQTNCRLYVSLFPCNECAKAIIQSGIRHVIYLSCNDEAPESTEAAKIMFELANVKFEPFNDVIGPDGMKFDSDFKICMDFC